MRLFKIVFVVVGWVSFVGCGSASVEVGDIGAAGGELCLGENKICVEFPEGALDTTYTFRIAPGSDLPAGAISDAYEINSNVPVKFLKPAAVRFNYSFFANIENLDVNVLRPFSHLPDGPWESLGKPDTGIYVDRVHQTVEGTVSHFSPFVVLRTDRLPDGTIPVEGDAGPVKVIDPIIPPYDASGAVHDAGRPDAGTPDAGAPDAGRPDAGTPDAGRPDAGTPDAGAPDAGPPDAGLPDAGPPDAGTADAGTPDAGAPDAGEPDAGADAGDPDAGDAG